MAAAADRLEVTGMGLEITPPLRDYSESKLGKAIKRHNSLLTSVALHLKVQKSAVHDTQHHGKELHVAECTALCKDKHVVRVCMESDSMYASIDLLAARLTRTLRKYKERRIEGKRSGKSMADDIAAVASTDEDDDVESTYDFMAYEDEVILLDEDEVPESWAFAKAQNGATEGATDTAAPEGFEWGATL